MGSDTWERAERVLEKNKSFTLSLEEAKELLNTIKAECDKEKSYSYCIGDTITECEYKRYLKAFTFCCELLDRIK